jgi:dTMP kinase
MSFFTKSKSGTTPKPQGRFIVIDGADGSGKTTQIQLLAETLQVSGYNNTLKLPGYDHALFDFPQYNTASAAMLERYLAGEYGKLPPEAASILYAIDRFDASYKLRDMLEGGKIVIANRYVTSNAGHQGAKIPDRSERIKFYRWLNDLEFNIFNIPKPHLNIILHVPSDITWELIEKRSIEQGRKRDLHEADKEHLQRAEQVYFEIAELFPNTRLIECVENGQLLSPNEIHAKVWELVRRIALKDLEAQATKTV